MHFTVSNLHIIRTKCLKQGVLLVGSCLLALTSQAQTLELALEQAWTRHPWAVSFSAREAEAQARADWAAGMTPTPPSLSLSNVSDRLNAHTGSDAWELELAIPLWLPGQRATRELEAQLIASELHARKQALRLELAGELRQVWWTLRGARLGAEMAQRRAASASKLETDVVRRYKAGEVARFDVNLVQSERLAAENEQLESVAALRQAELAYQILTGVSAPQQLPPEVRAAASAQATLHPQLAVAQAAVKLAQARLNIAQTSSRETPELSLQLQRERPDFSAPYAQTVGVKLNLPLSSGTRLRQEGSAAQAEWMQAQAEYDRVRQRLEMDSTLLPLEVESTQTQWDKARENWNLATDNLRLTEKSFSLGETDLAGLLRMRLAAFEAEAQVNRQQLAYFSALSRLNQSLGVFP